MDCPSDYCSTGNKKEGEKVRGKGDMYLEHSRDRHRKGYLLEKSINASNLRGSIWQYLNNKVTGHNFFLISVF